MKRSLKRFTAGFTAAGLAFSLCACVGGGEAKNSGGDEKTKIAFVSYMAIDQAEWLQNLDMGLKDYQALHDELEIKMVEATQTSEYEPKVRALAESGYDIIITSYDNMAEATTTVAKDYPEVKFGSMDGGIRDLEQYDNIEEFGLSRVETAYLAGVAAAKMTETGKVGIVGGSDVGPINEIIAGWQQGLRSVDPDIEDIVVYANSFTDPTKGKELGLALIGKGCDVIGGAAGGSGVGTAQAAAGDNVYYVGWDVHYEDVVGELELGSAVNFFDKMVIQFIEDTLSGNYSPGVRTIYGLKEGTCDFESLDNSLISEEAKEAVETAREAIEAGEIEISTEPLHK